jgi:hypothetical protein
MTEQQPFADVEHVGAADLLVDTTRDQPIIGLRFHAGAEHVTIPLSRPFAEEVAKNLLACSAIYSGERWPFFVKESKKTRAVSPAKARLGFT